MTNTKILGLIFMCPWIFYMGECIYKDLVVNSSKGFITIMFFVLACFGSFLISKDDREENKI